MTENPRSEQQEQTEKRQRVFTGRINDYPETYLDCRENHLWHWDTDWKLVRGRSGSLLEFTRTKVCERCGTRVHKRYDGKTGRALGNKNYYEYPDGYLASQQNRFDTGMARLEMLRRAGIIRGPQSRTRRSGKEQE